MKPGLSQAELLARLPVFEPLLNAIAVFIMATIYLFWDASRAVYVLLSLAALVFLVKYRPQMPSDHRLYSWPIIGYVGAAALSLLFNGLPDRGVNILGSRFLLLLIAIPLTSIFYLSFDLKRNVWIKFAVGCMAMGVLALVDILLLHEERAGAGHNQAAFGFVALAMTSIVTASYHRFSQIRFGKTVFFLAILMGVCAMILSGTRTSWLGGVVVFTIAMIFYLDRFSLFKRVLFALTLIVGIVVVSSSLPIVQKRIDKMIDMVTPYVTGEEQTKSNGLRLRVEAWKLGWQAGLENKIFGFGPGNTKRAIKDYARQYPQVKKLENLNHIHNQFIQSFAMTGLIGLFSFLALIFCHFWIFIKYLGKRYSLEVRCLALAGLLLLVSYLLKSIPGVPFFGKQYLMMYGFASATIWGSLLGALRESESSEARTSAL
jgi:MFS family permease